MPTGQTAKRTVTAYRAVLLKRLRSGTITRRSVSSAERRQYNDLCVYGWVKGEGDKYSLTALGLKILDSYERTAQAA